RPATRRRRPFARRWCHRWCRSPRPSAAHPHRRRRSRPARRPRRRSLRAHAGTMDSALLCPPVVWAALGTLRDRWGATAQGCTPGAPQSRDAQKGGGGNRSLAPALALARGWAGVEGSGVDLFLLLLRGLDHLLRDVGRHFLVAVELARVRSPALRERTQRRRVLVELGLRHERADPRLPAIRIHAQDLAAALVQVTDDVAHVLVGRDDL